MGADEESTPKTIGHEQAIALIEGIRHVVEKASPGTQVVLGVMTKGGMAIGSVNMGALEILGAIRVMSVKTGEHI